MKRSKTAYLYKWAIEPLQQNSVLLSVLLLMFRFFQLKAPIPAAAASLCWWRWRTKDHSWASVAILLAIMSAQMFRMTITVPVTGMVTEVHEHYAVVTTLHGKALFYGEQLLSVDSIVTLTGSVSRPVNQKGFYSFDYEGWCRRKNIQAVIRNGDASVIRQYRTIRYYIENAVSRIEPSDKRKFLSRFLLNRYDRDQENSYLFDQGFSLSGCLLVLDGLMKQRVERGKRRAILFTVCVWLWIIYRFPLIGSQWLLGHPPQGGDHPDSIKSGWVLSTILFLYPSAVSNTAFLTLMIYRLVPRDAAGKKAWQLFLVAILQSIFYHSFNPLAILLFSIMRPIIGVTAISAWIQFFIPSAPIYRAVYAVDSLFSFIDTVTLPGTVLGAGLPFFAITCWTERKSKHMIYWWVVQLLLFQQFGLFHPLGEVTFINVGQGDSILIRAPFNTANILVDTGKASQYDAVDCLLQAKGIRKIDRLFISHHDEDHDGNEAAIGMNYHVHCTVDEHFQTLNEGPYQISDVSTISNNDGNESSLVLLTKINGLTYMLTGDIDTYAEKQILRTAGTIRADILKCSHHGSRSGNSEMFLNTIQPRIAIISCGAYAIYHHPSSTVTTRLEAHHIPYFLTRNEGDISFLCVSRANILLTSSGKIGIIRS